MKITFDTGTYGSDISIITVAGVVDRLKDTGYLGENPKNVTAEIDCGCDLTVSYDDDDGDRIDETFYPTLLCDYLFFAHCFWAKDPKNRDVLVGILD